MKKERIDYLYGKYLKKELTSGERAEWEELSLDLNNDPFFQELVAGLWEVKEDAAPSMDVGHAARIEEFIVAQPRHVTSQQAVVKTRLWPRIVAAAVILLVAGAGLLYFTGSENRGELVSVKADTLIKQGATLMLANGKKIKLSDATSGELAKEEGVVITKTADGQLVYEIKNSESDNNKTNTLSTARGETYIVTLPDKSRVWLNAASSLTYLASLNDEGRRIVNLKGEAYFEVSKDKMHPFIVKSGGQEVEVLGTTFNVNNYSRKIKTTLVEGKVKVDIPGGGKQLILSPGQQARFDRSTGNLEKGEVDVFLYTAWKDGLIVYQNAEMAELMEELGRLYDYEIVFKDQNLKQLHFTGRADKSESIQSVLNIIERTSDLKFTIKERRIIVERSTKR